MNRKGGKPGPREDALKIGLDFNEALERFMRTDPKELPPNEKRPGGDKPPGPKPSRRANKLTREPSSGH